MVWGGWVARIVLDWQSVLISLLTVDPSSPVEEVSDMIED